MQNSFAKIIVQAKTFLRYMCRWLKSTARLLNINKHNPVIFLTLRLWSPTITNNLSQKIKNHILLPVIVLWSTAHSRNALQSCSGVLLKKLWVRVNATWYSKPSPYFRPENINFHNPSSHLSRPLKSNTTFFRTKWLTSIPLGAGHTYQISPNKRVPSPRSHASA